MIFSITQKDEKTRHALLAQFLLFADTHGIMLLEKKSQLA